MADADRYRQAADRLADVADSMRRLALRDDHPNEQMREGIAIIARELASYASLMTVVASVLTLVPVEPESHGDRRNT